MSCNVVWHSHPVDQQTRAEQKQQKPLVIWFTGLSASGVLKAGYQSVAA